MFASLITNMFALAEGEAAPWWNIPSFEVWRWVNLIIFVGLFIYILRRPVSEAMRARREGIRRDLMRAQEERNAALAKLEEVEARLVRLDVEVASLHEQSQKEAADERERIRRSTEEETQKLREQAQREIESAGKAARQELQEFAAEQSVRLAEEMIRRDIKPEDDARLVSLRVEELGGVKR
ncbi:MAG: F-type H+-transporting ATPase subunit b [Acidobacteriota bacterium]|jgi:F0F1-type ATP synthase membrane subunit b/b'|nr:F-type H+-transporting ATPase subunit b [Acidobacteriota bacterium]